MQTASVESIDGWRPVADVHGRSPRVLHQRPDNDDSLQRSCSAAITDDMLRRGARSHCNGKVTPTAVTRLIKKIHIARNRNR